MESLQEALINTGFCLKGRATLVRSLPALAQPRLVDAALDELTEQSFIVHIMDDCPAAVAEFADETELYFVQVVLSLLR